ncbi:hypothetical protein G3N59_01180 [Paraburkholderia sp. Ac-20340]|uniref:hypothetical protein n=1 Tax=Paraburkholderia sp. Ac-20340 TaxID=2703888 RepID=UPI001982662B|nr:hypothetical protein [Paraburkholderia sp. Ac-20340]MBN3851980.1 hypothetical protein [Paraburkholderia sp. Ac-20340]
MKNDIANYLSAAALIALASDSRVIFGPTWLRMAASAYRRDRSHMAPADVEILDHVDREVLQLAYGEGLFDTQWSLFAEFQKEINRQIAEAFR